MTDFILLYKGPARDMASMSEAEVKESGKKWELWMKKLGDSLVEFGAPMSGGVSVADDGSISTASDLNGYSIIRAENIDEAKEFLKIHPHLNGNEGKYSIEIYELTPM